MVKYHGATFSLKHDRKNNCIVLVFRGIVTMGVIREVAPQVARLTAETGCMRILNDMRGAKIEISFIDVFDSPRVMDESQISRRTVRALVVPKDFEHRRFLETVTRNRSHNLMVFTDIKEAKKWLFADDGRARDAGKAPARRQASSPGRKKRTR